VDETFDRVNPADFDEVLLPGGARNADALRAESKATEFVREIDRAGKPIAVICYGSWLLQPGVQCRLLESPKRKCRLRRSR
jgi:protease I